MSYTIYLCTPEGQRLHLVDQFDSLQVVTAVNKPGRFTVTLPGTFDRSVVRWDGLVGIWREGRFLFAGFVRQMKLFESGGSSRLALSGPGVLDLLRRRIVAYPAGSANAVWSDAADDIMRAIVRYNLGSDATVAARQLAAISVGDDLGQGPALDKRAAWKNILDLLSEISAASVQAGTPIYFDLVPLWDDAVTLEFRTYLDQRGADRTLNGPAPLVFNRDWGNLDNPVLVLDYEDEVNYAYVGGQGEGANREVVERSDSTRIGLSVWNRNEAFVHASNEQSTAELEDRGDAVLDERAPALRFSADLASVPPTLFGADWNLGDRVTCQYEGFSLNGMIDAVRVGVDGQGVETISARVDI